MNILIINSGRSFTGEAAHCIDLAEQLLLQGHEVGLVVRGDGQLKERAEERNLPIACELRFHGGLRLDYTLSDLFKLRNLLSSLKPDIIHCHRGNDHGLAVAARALVGGKKTAVIRTRHRVVPVRNTVANRWLFREKTDGVIAVSKKAAQSFGEMGKLIEEKLTLIYSSVDTKGFNPTHRCDEWRASHGLNNDIPLIGLIARLQRVKGQEHFLRAAALVARKFPKVRFIVAGKGPAHKRVRMEKLATELGIHDRLIIENWLPDIHKVTASLDVGVLASLGSEGSSRVTYEYMASGVPVVATAVGCVPEIVFDGHTGWIVPPADPAAMAEAIIKTLESPEVRNEMRMRALAHITEFHNRERWAAETVAAYDQAIQGTKSTQTGKQPTLA